MKNLNVLFYANVISLFAVLIAFEIELIIGGISQFLFGLYQIVIAIRIKKRYYEIKKSTQKLFDIYLKAIIIWIGILIIVGYWEIIELQKILIITPLLMGLFLIIIQDLVQTESK